MGRYDALRSGEETMRIIAAMVVLLGVSLANAQPNKEAYDLQDRCGRRAAEVFAKNYENFELGGRTHSYSYRNHYSPRLNKCFFVVQHLDYAHGKINEAVRVLELFDVNENNNYGTFIGTRGTPPTMCEVRDRECKSESEWYELVRPYMDD